MNVEMCVCVCTTVCTEYIYTEQLLIFTCVDNVSFCLCFEKVWVHEGLSDIEDDYEFCVSVPAATAIPSAGYFGVSAATGGLSGMTASHCVSPLTPPLHHAPMPATR